MRIIPVGLLGFGLAGSIFHSRVMAAVPSLRITRVMTSRVDEVARELPGAIAVATVAEVLRDPAIELVVIATPNASHAGLAEQALRAGKHVVIDKPMTTVRADADALIALAAERGRLLSVYQNRRWDGDFRTIRQLIDAGRLGRIYSYEAHYDRFRPAIKPGWREAAQPGSGILFDLGAHLIDQALVLFGMPQTVTADVIAQRADARVDDYVHLVLGYGERRAILHIATLVREPGPHFAVHGDGGSFLSYGMDPQEARLKAGEAAGGPAHGSDIPPASGTLVRADGERETVPLLPGSYGAFYAGIAAAIANGAPVPVRAEDARDVIAIIELAKRSATAGCTLSTAADDRTI